MSKLRETAVFVLLLMILGMPESAMCGSPYSANGFGVIIPDNFGISKSLGSSGVAIGEAANMMRGNPAVFATYVRPAYSIAALYEKRNTDIGGKDNPINAKTNFNLIKFVLPVYKGIVVSWGLSPYSRSDVKIGMESTSGEIKNNGVVIRESMKVFD